MSHSIFLHMIATNHSYHCPKKIQNRWSGILLFYMICKNTAIFTVTVIHFIFLYFFPLLLNHTLSIFVHLPCFFCFWFLFVRQSHIPQLLPSPLPLSSPFFPSGHPPRFLSQPQKNFNEVKSRKISLTL